MSGDSTARRQVDRSPRSGDDVHRSCGIALQLVSPMAYVDARKYALVVRCAADCFSRVCERPQIDVRAPLEWSYRSGNERRLLAGSNSSVNALLNRRRHRQGQLSDEADECVLPGPGAVVRPSSLGRSVVCFAQVSGHSIKRLLSTNVTRKNYSAEPILSRGPCHSLVAAIRKRSSDDEIRQEDTQFLSSRSSTTQKIDEQAFGAGSSIRRCAPLATSWTA